MFVINTMALTQHEALNSHAQKKGNLTRIDRCVHELVHELF